MKSPVKMLTDLAGRLAGARTALEQVRDADQELRATHAQLDAERLRLAIALEPRDEVLAAIARDVAHACAAWRGQHGMDVVRAASGRVNVTPGDVVEGTTPGNVLAALPSPLDGPALCGLVPEVIAASLTAIANAETWEPGPPHAGRPALIAALREKIRTVEAQHAELCDRAAEMGLEIPLMAEERGRRIQAAQRAERAETFNRSNAAGIRRGSVKAME